MKAREINDLVTEWGTYDKVSEALRELMKRASLLSFALRAPSFTDPELRQLDKLARDAVCSDPLCQFVLLRRHVTLTLRAQ